ncbi:MAG: hypothetical protein NVSMB18_00670 [Acetobacteraceae bacterium]
MMKAAALLLGAALCALPARAQPAPPAGAAASGPERPPDRGPVTPEANRAYPGGGVVLEGPPGAPPPPPGRMPPEGPPPR